MDIYNKKGFPVYVAKTNGQGKDLSEICETALEAYHAQLKSYADSLEFARGGSRFQAMIDAEYSLLEAAHESAVTAGHDIPAMPGSRRNEGSSSSALPIAGLGIVLANAERWSNRR